MDVLHLATGKDINGNPLTPEAVRNLQASLTVDAVMLGIGIYSKIKLKNIKKASGKSFRSEELLDSHYAKHGSELKNVQNLSEYSKAQYLNDANHVIKNGTYVEELNGYVKLLGGKGSAKYAFVGIDQAGKITTLHIKTVTELIKKAPSLGLGK